MLNPPLPVHPEQYTSTLPAFLLSIANSTKLGGKNERNTKYTHPEQSETVSYVECIENEQHQRY